MSYITKHSVSIFSLMLIALAVFTQNAYAAKPKNPVPRAVVAQIDTMCTTETYRAMQTATAFCLDPSGIFEQLLGIQSQLDAVIQAGFGLLPTDLPGALQRAFFKCMSNNPLLSLFQRFMGIFEGLLPDMDILAQLGQCVMNAIRQIIGELVQQFLGPILKFIKCLTGIFKNLLSALQSIVDTIKGLVANVISFVERVINRLKTGIINCLGAAFADLAGVLGDCINLGTGMLRSFDFLSKLTGIKFSPFAMMQEMLGCIGQAAAALINGPLSALQDFYKESQRLMGMISALAQLLKLKLPNGKLNFAICTSSSMSKATANLSKLRQQCSKYNREKKKYR